MVYSVGFILFTLCLLVVRVISNTNYLNAFLMKKITLIILLCVIELISCRYEKLTFFRSDGIILIDSLDEKGTGLSFDGKEIMGFYPIYYNGIVTDTILLNETSLPKYSADNNRVKYDRNLSIKDLALFVDTNLKMVHQLRFYDEFDNKGARNVDSTSNINAYGFIIKNNSKLNIHLGIMGSICSMVRQAKNTNDEWIDVEIPRSYTCETGASQVIIPSRGMIIGKIMRYQGDIIKECRLKLTIGKESIFSNVFIDSLDSRQLAD